MAHHSDGSGNAATGASARIAGIVLAAGQGTRMRSLDMHKVCFPVAGTPSVNRMLAVLRGEGVEPVVVVVGALAESVMNTVGAAYPDTLFVLQKEPKGTGEAARCGFTPLGRIGFSGLVLVTMGDKVVVPSVLVELKELFFRSKCDAVFAVSRKAGRHMGRVSVRADGSVDWLIEAADIERAGRRRIKTPSGEITAEEARRGGRFVNESVYLLRAEALEEGLASLRPRTRGGEEYLPDVITYLLSQKTHDGAARFKVRALVLDDPDDVIGFNTPDELLAVEAVVARREKKDMALRQASAGQKRLDRGLLMRAAGWLDAFEKNSPRIRRAMRRIYGDTTTLIDERRRAYIKVLKLFIRKYGPERKVVINRAPGRINIMGRHVEHRGGYINPMALNREVIMAASTREDDVVRLANVNHRAFPDRSFSISEQLAAVPWDDWLSFINSRRVQQMVMDAGGDWSNYVKAVCLRLQTDFRNVRLSGMDAAVIGDIPMAAGLSSSSAIVVAAGEAMIACNRLDITASDFVDLCGKGEWYVGSRGGAGDHAALKFGRRGQVSRVRFFPFSVEHIPGIPDDCRLVIFDSHIKARKSADARAVFNRKIVAYELGLMYVLDRYPHFAHLVEHLRDFNPVRLNVKPHVIYDVLLALPATVKPGRFARDLSKANRGRAEELFKTHGRAESYDIRDVILYGIAECRRSERCGALLEAADMRELGRMMNISHDGDRVARLSASGKTVPHDWRISDDAIRRLIEDLQSEDPLRVERAQFYNQPGGYSCSVPEIDMMVDIANSVDGVLGAQLSGAGLGGCMMVLVRTEAVGRLRRALSGGFYKPRGLKPDVTVSQPAEGSGLLRI